MVFSLYDPFFPWQIEWRSDSSSLSLSAFHFFHSSYQSLSPPSFITTLTLAFILPSCLFLQPLSLRFHLLHLQPCLWVPLSSAQSSSHSPRLSPGFSALFPLTLWSGCALTPDSSAIADSPRSATWTPQVITSQTPPHGINLGLGPLHVHACTHTHSHAGYSKQVGRWNLTRLPTPDGSEELFQLINNVSSTCFEFNRCLLVTMKVLMDLTDRSGAQMIGSSFRAVVLFCFSVAKTIFYVSMRFLSLFSHLSASQTVACIKGQPDVLSFTLRLSDTDSFLFLFA